MGVAVGVGVLVGVLVAVGVLEGVKVAVGVLDGVLVGASGVLVLKFSAAVVAVALGKAGALGVGAIKPLLSLLAGVLVANCP